MCATVQLLRVSVHERISAAAEDFLLQAGKGELTAEVPVSLRALLTERLTAAAEEIVGLFEETVAEYEDRVERSEREICRQRRLLDAVLKPQVKLHRAGFPADVQQLSVIKEEVPPEQQQEWRPSLDQEEPPHIKEEQEEVRTSQEGEQLQGFTFTPVPVKSEDDDDEEKPQSSQLHQRQTEQMETDDGEDCGGPEPARNSDPDEHLQPVSEDNSPDSTDTDDSDCDWMQANKTPSGMEGQTNSEAPDIGAKERPFPCSYCGKRFSLKGNLNRHIRDHTGERPFPCTGCDKSFKDSGSLTAHMRCHTGEQPYSCLFCGKNFSGRGNMTRHMRIHTGEKPFTCSVCSKSFHVKEHLNRHMKYHTGEKPFSCTVCGKGCAQKTDLKKHMRVHTGEKPFSCPFCVKDEKSRTNCDRKKLQMNFYLEPFY
uniref:C2H2-type domain-containing protein n=1 Tax=Dicentrarchus labrax TaxID=13489 RepID=A0A8P4KIS5_DICLA